MGVNLVKRARACGFKGSKQATLIALADRANEKRLKDRDCCWPSLATLSNDAGYCIRTVQGQLNELEQEDHITRFYQTGGVTKYWVHPGGKPTPANSAGVQKLHPSPADIAPNPRKTCGETIKNQKKNQGATPIGAVACGVVTQLVQRAGIGNDYEQVDPKEFAAFVKAYSRPR